MEMTQRQSIVLPGVKLTCPAASQEKPETTGGVRHKSPGKYLLARFWGQYELPRREATDALENQGFSDNSDDFG